MSDGTQLTLYILDGVLLLYILYYWKEELTQLAFFNIHYFATFWNYLDICFLLTTTAYLISDI